MLDVALAVGGHVAAMLLDPDLHLQAGGLRGQRGDVVIGLQNLHVGIGRDVGGRNFAGAANGKREHLRLVGVQFDRKTFEVEQQVGGVFDHARDRGELVKHPVDF